MVEVYTMIGATNVNFNIVSVYPEVGTIKEITPLNRQSVKIKSWIGISNQFKINDIITSIINKDFTTTGFVQGSFRFEATGIGSQVFGFTKEKLATAQ